MTSDIAPSGYPSQSDEPKLFGNVTAAPLAVIGGLLTVKRFVPLYRQLLDRDDSTDLPAEERFIPPPEQGLGEVEYMEAELAERLEALHDKAGGLKLFLVGHSLGGFMAVRAALMRPDMVAGVVSMAGVHDGAEMDPRKPVGVAGFALRHALGDPREAVHLQHDSPFMHEHRERVASEWPSDVPFYVISTALDCLVVPPRGYGMEMPEGQKPEEKLVVPNLPGAEWLARRALGIPCQVEALRARFVPGHVTLPLSPTAIDYVDQSRRVATGSAIGVQLRPQPMQAAA